MRRRLFVQKGITFVLAAAIALSLAGCSKDGNLKKPGYQESLDEEQRKLAWQKGSIILEDEDNLYICGDYRVMKIKRATKEEQILWENEELAHNQRVDLYAGGEGLLVGDKIYFIEDYEEDEGESRKRVLSVITTDGTGYERLLELPYWWNRREPLILKDGVIYVASVDEVINYPLGEKGASETSVNQDAQNIYDVIGCQECKVYNDKYCLTENFTDGHVLYLTDRESLEKKELASLPFGRQTGSKVKVLDMDDEYVYLEESGGDGIYLYKKLNLATGEESLVFERKNEWKSFVSPDEIMDITVKDGYLYYVGDQDYKLYVMRRSLAEPEREELLGEAFYDTGIGEVGSLVCHSEEVYSKEKPDVLIFRAQTERLKVDQRFAGADKINQYLAEWQEQGCKNTREAAEEVLKEQEEYIVSYYYYDSILSKEEEIYFDRRYLSFRQEDYDYWGGAHGMPSWIGFTFDLRTGNRLTLKDVIRNSEEELKEIVTTYFGKLIDEAPEEFWPDARDVVRDTINLDYDFYLTKEGIHFDFAPYALACFAAGIQEVVIPYEEFDLKISLKAASSGKETVASKEPEKVFSSEDWGLGYGEPGTIPRGNAKEEDLAYYNAYFVGAGSEKVLYLTFDCGYENGNTEAILDALKKHNAPGTFFVVGHYLETAPDLVKRMVDEGHKVGNHTYHHPNMSSIAKKEDFQKELDDVADLFKEITGTELSLYYRPPQGKCNAENLKMAKELGYATIFWSVAHVDWMQDKQPSHEDALDKLMSRVHPGAVVLLHNTSQTNGEILDELLTKWEEMGYTFLPLSDLTGQN